MRELRISTSITNHGSEALNAYLADVAKEKLVSAEEEVELARTIRKGGVAGRRAEEKLIKANLRFVVSVAKQYQHRGIELMDLVTEGNLGLIKAAEKFDETRGFKFISYAVWWIRQSILQALAQNSRIVRIPSNQLALLNQIIKLGSEFEQINGRQPSFEELAEELDVSVQTVRDMMMASGRHVSVDAPLTDDESGCVMIDMFADDSSATDDGLMNESLAYVLDCRLNTLTQREKGVLEMYYGIGQPAMTLNEIGARYDLTSERVRQIKNKAIYRLRHNAQS